MGLEGLTSEQKSVIEKARKRVVESIGKNMDLYGVNHTTGHLYGSLFFQNQPITLDDMVEDMGMSKASMSTSVRTLVDLNMINKVWERGFRKDLYQAEADWFQTFTDFFAIKWRKAMEINLQALRKSLSELKRLAANHAQDERLHQVLSADIEKLEMAVGYYLWLGTLIDKLESGEIYEFVPKERADN
ncbi:GbsR/MarR family transcriptional regulator [Paenibacillus xerothermodurans]|uniref:HTH-type transcriptional regulator n=1 Tax=Paenibacillus xerothermodurans TaxID=1977292 RepID=A0A2W1N4R2_PAEXE|nr:GbsR/MarR family transcriptional regulator [Paenibacillus xerothermodurans]PZE19719.1 GbsR/MarR family transcriptional regulator [Paenibacillus xerothermodurans]